MRQIGRYQVVSELGRGAMGVVYRARDPIIERDVAIKVIHPQGELQSAQTGHLRDRLFQEAKASGRLEHPGIVRIYDVGTHEGLGYITMEFVDGVTLDERIRNGPSADFGFACDILRQTGAALDYAHKQEVVHRDIKPANLMVTKREEVRITDFGIARITTSTFAKTGLVVGTPGYMSPEQVQDHPLDGRSDQFSLGVIAYQLFAGKKPFIGGSPYSIMFKIVTGITETPKELNPKVSPELDQAILKALARDPNDRHPCCEAFADAVEAACQKRRITKETLRPQEWTPEKPLPTARLPKLPSKPRPERSGRDVAAAPTPWTEVIKVQFSRPGVRKFLAWTASTVVIALGAALVFWPSRVPVRFVTTEPGATVVVDSNPGASCKSPCSLDLSPGEHDLSVQLAGFADIRKPFEVGGEAIELALELSPALTSVAIISDQTGIEVVVDGKDDQSCVVPCSLVLPPGKHEVVGRQKGFIPTRKSFEVGSKPLELPLAALEAAPPPLPPVLVTFTSTSLGAKLIVDESQQHSCVTPCGLEILPGRHYLTAVLPGFIRATTSFEVGQQPREVFVRLQAVMESVYISSTPDGADIFVDGRRIEQKTPAQVDLSKGPHVIRVEKENFEPQQRSISAGDGNLEHRFPLAPKN